MNRVLLGITATIALGFGVQTWRVHSLKSDIVTLETKLTAANDRADKSEELRAAEQVQGNASYAAADMRCADRVTHAREVGAIIKEITNVQEVQAGGDHGRPIVFADRLRIIAGQGGAAETVGLPSGTDSGASQ